MKIFAISDLHLSLNNPKPMDIFGPVWDNYIDKVFADWRAKVGDDDIVLLAGDFSWAINLEDTKPDFDLLKDLPGKKVLIRGNHDYWWKSISAVRAVLPEGFFAIQNDALRFGNVVVCGTRGWMVDEEEKMTPENLKIFNREVIRLELTLQAAAKIRQPGDKLVCMIHYPPTNSKRDDSKFSQLFERYNVDYVVFGHLHAYRTIPQSFVKNDITYFLTSCDLVDNKLTFICQDKD